MAQGKRKRRRKLPIALALFILLIAAAAVAARFFLLDGDRVRRFFESSVAHYTGMAMQIAHLDVTLFPAHVVATGVRLTVPDATATADRVEVRLDLQRLFSREIAITTGDIAGLVVHVPEDPVAISEIIQRVEDRIKETRGGGGRSAISVSIAEVAAAAHVYMGENPVPFAVANVRVDDILSSRVGIHADVALQSWGDVARLYGDVELLRAEPGHPWQGDGTARFAGIQTERMPITNPPEGILAGDISFTPTDAGPGAELRARLEAPGRPEITGNIDALAVWTGERADVHRLLWEASGARLEGSGAIASARDWSVTLREAHASEAALDAILALLEQPRVHFEADPGAQIAIADVVVDSLDGDWRVDHGSLDFAGLTIISPVDGPARDGIAQATRGLRGAITAAAGVVTLREVRSNDLRVEGTLAPDREAHTLRVDLRGEADLSRMPWTLLNERGDLQHVQGRLAVTRFTGTFDSGGATPEDLSVEAELRDAAIRYVDSDVVVDLQGVRGSLITNGNGVATEISATDTSGAPVALAGNYDVKAHQWVGTLKSNLQSTVPGIFENSTYLRELRALSETVGASTFNAQVDFPTKTSDRLLVVFTRQADNQNAVAARLEFDQRVTAFSIESTLSVQRVFDEYLPKLRGDGTVRTTVDYDRQKSTFSLAVDATNCAITSDSILRKPAGVGFTFAASGDTGHGWSITTAEVTARGTPFIKTTGPVRDGSVPFEAQLSALPAFLPDGATASGTIRGRLNTDGAEGEFDLADAAVALNSTVALDRIHGHVAFGPDSFMCDSLTLHGARSDCSFTLAREAGRWNGRASGVRLDVGAVTDFVDAARALRPRSREVATSSSLWTDPFLGEFSFDLGELYYHRGRLGAVHFRVLGEERAMRFTEFSARQGEGSLLGSFVILPGDTTDAVVKSAVKWTQFDGRTLNDMVFPEDRGFFGIFDGELTFEAPLGSAKEMMAAGNGSARFTGKDGSLGQIGFASKLLTVLKTTEIINLKAPTLRDRGLVFNTVNGVLTLIGGVMSFEGVKLDGGAYAIESKGTIDFAQDSTNADAYVRVLESVGRIMRKVPLIGDIASALSTDLIGVPVHFSGSPYDVQVGVTGKNVASTPMRAGAGAVKAVEEGFKRLIPGGNNKVEDAPK